jgi:hypothetical protein
MTESTFKLRTLGSDTMLNYHLSQKLKLIERDNFNHYINTLTKCREELVPWALSPSHANLNLFRTKLIGLFLKFMVLMQIPKRTFYGKTYLGFRMFPSASGVTLMLPTSQMKGLGLG